MKQANDAGRGSWRRSVRLLDFDVPKRICFGSYAEWAAGYPAPSTGLEDVADAVRDLFDFPESDDDPSPQPCGWLSGDNEVWTTPADPGVGELFAESTWKHSRGGTTLGVIGWQ